MNTEGSEIYLGSMMWDLEIYIWIGIRRRSCCGGCERQKAGHSHLGFGPPSKVGREG
jgi:hypothetical protein